MPFHGVTLTAALHPRANRGNRMVTRASVARVLLMLWQRQRRVTSTTREARRSSGSSRSTTTWNASL
jgi:hypothetical protein